MKGTAARIIINLGLDAINRLIGGDSEVEIELRNTVVQQFARRHLKPVVNTEAFRQVQQELLVGVRQEIEAQLGSTQRDYIGRILGVTLDPKVKKDIEAYVGIAVGTVVAEAVVKATQNLAEDIQARVDAQVECKVRELVQAKLDKLRSEL